MLSEDSPTLVRHGCVGLRGSKLSLTPTSRRVVSLHAFLGFHPDAFSHRILCEVADWLHKLGFQVVVALTLVFGVRRDVV